MNMPARYFDSSRFYPGSIPGTGKSKYLSKTYSSATSIEAKDKGVKMTDVDTYYNEMSKSLQDKLFFLNKVEGSMVIDYGCGDGSVLFALRDRMTGGALLGFDIDANALSRAEKRYNELGAKDSRKSTITFTDQWDLIEKNFKMYQNYGMDTTFVFNSVIHEVLSYQDQANIDNFWKRLYESNVTNIVIRDMMPSKNIEGTADTDTVDSIREICSKDSDLQQRLTSFEDVWGSLDSKKNMTHFLLKYRFKENWDREVKENYFPIYIENFLEKMPVQYDVTMIEQFTVPFVKEQVKKDFNIDFDCKTHIKLILRRENINGNPTDS